MKTLLDPPLIDEPTDHDVAAAISLELHRLRRYRQVAYARIGDRGPNGEPTHEDVWIYELLPTVLTFQAPQEYLDLILDYPVLRSGFELTVNDEPVAVLHWRAELSSGWSQFGDVVFFSYEVEPQR